MASTLGRLKEMCHSLTETFYGSQPDLSFTSESDYSLELPPNATEIEESRMKSVLMDNLISVINKIQDALVSVSCKAIDLPQIVVIGSQSAGKSSVIEALVGRPFLPRGSGIVTRRPLILQLIACPLNDRKYRSEEKETLGVDEWGEFLHLEDQIFFDFDDIRNEIQDETNRVAGSNKGICPEPINLKIYSKNVVNLTLIDLPGMTTVPVGDQPPDIEDQIKKLVSSYIRNKNSIILAVSAANTDIVTSEAIKLAKIEDPDGDRTLAILTKLDLMDEATDASEALKGRVIPVKLGIIGVVNRSQKDINEEKGIDYQHEKEAEFLKQKYPRLAAKNGTPYLAKALNSLLTNHIKKCFPGLKDQIEEEIEKTQEKLKSYGEEITDKESTLKQVILEFVQAYRTTITGEHSRGKMAGTTHIYNIFHEKFQRDIKSIEPKVNLSQDDIKMALNAMPGPRPALHNIPLLDVPFEKLVKKQIQQLERPSVECVVLIYKEMIRMIDDCGGEIKNEMKRFPKLHKKIASVMERMLNKRLEETKLMVESKLAMEISYINKKHPDFKIAKAGVPKLMPFGKKHVDHCYGKKEADDCYETKALLLRQLELYNGDLPAFHPPRTEQEENCEILVKLINSYFLLSRKTIQDSVPKVVMHSFVNFVENNLKDVLNKEVCGAKDAEWLLDENKATADARKEAALKLESLKRAKDVISEMSDVFDSEH